MATSVLRRRIPWIALLPIAVLQLTIAVHQFEHVATYIDDSCPACAQLDRLGAALDEVAERTPLPPDNRLRPPSPSTAASPDTWRSFDSRAPPGL